MGKSIFDPGRWESCDGKISGDPNELDRIEQMSIQTAIKLSLEEAQKKIDEPTDLPKRKFKVEEIEEDEKKRDVELYGPPTPPRRPRQVGAMSSKESSANTVPAAGPINKPSGTGAAKHPQKAGPADERLKAEDSGIFIPKPVIDKLPDDVWSAVADAVAYHKQHVSDQTVRQVVDVMLGYNGKADEDALPAWPRTSANNFPASRGARLANKKQAAPLDHFRHGLDGAAAAAAAVPKPPSHAERMAVIRGALGDPDSALSVAVREQSRFVRGQRSQRARGESSAGARPGSKRAGPPQKEARRD